MAAVTAETKAALWAEKLVDGLGVYLGATWDGKKGLVLEK